MVPYDSAGGRIEVFTSKGRETKSNLVIKKAGPSDSGNYTCKPSIAREASIKVHVLESKFVNYFLILSATAPRYNDSSALLYALNYIIMGSKIFMYEISSK